MSVEDVKEQYGEESEEYLRVKKTAKKIDQDDNTELNLTSFSNLGALPCLT